jgi:predicted nuclease of predicted toxin-antitoxin system
VTGLGIRLYTDEDVDPRVARQLSRHGYDALSCVDAGNHNQKYDDDWQLRFATSQ